MDFETLVDILGGEVIERVGFHGEELRAVYILDPHGRVAVIAENGIFFWQDEDSYKEDENPWAMITFD